MAAARSAAPMESLRSRLTAGLARRTVGADPRSPAHGDAVLAYRPGVSDDSQVPTMSLAYAVASSRHSDAAVRLYVRDALCADAVGRTVAWSACCLGDPSLAEPLDRLRSWWDVDVELLEQAQRRCDPARAEATTDLITAFIRAAELSHLHRSVSSVLSPVDVDHLEVNPLPAA
jgi:hypothetical protein